MTLSLIRKKTVPAILLSLVVITAGAQSPYYPDTAWLVKKPEEL